MNCRVGDFGLSIDLISAEGGGENSNGIYSGGADTKIPVRWSSLEGILYNSFSTSSDVWSFGVLMWEIWSYAELPYAGMTNAKVKEQVNLGYRLPKPASCPDSIYKIMIDCWNKNVKRRVTMLAVNEALVMAWHEITGGEHDDAGNAVNNIYDNQQESENIYDNQQESEDAPDDSHSDRKNTSNIPLDISHYTDLNESSIRPRTATTWLRAPGASVESTESTLGMDNIHYSSVGSVQSSQSPSSAATMNFTRQTNEAQNVANLADEKSGYMNLLQETEFE